MNVEGTKIIIAAAIDTGVQRIVNVYTSSSGVVFEGKSIQGLSHSRKSLWMFIWIFATLAEWVVWVRGEEPIFNRFAVTFACTSSIEKTKRALGYKPDVSL